MFFVRHWNKRGSKTALLIHGLGSSSHTWHTLAKDLAKQDYHVIAPDLAGHGRSEWKDGYSLEDWSQQITNLNIINPELVVGHSLGGLIVANIYKQLQPKKVILIDPMFKITSDTNALRVLQTLFKIGSGSLPLLTHVMGPAPVIKTATYKKWSEEDREIVANDFKIWDSKSVITLQWRKDILRYFFTHTKDTLIFRSRASFLVPVHWLKKANHERIQFITMNTSHWIHIEDYPTFWLNVAQFLERTV